MLKKLLNIPRLIFALAAFALAMPNGANAQQSFVLPDGTSATGHLNAGGPPPVGTGCTIAALSTDAAGTCTTTAAAGTIVFARAFATTAPRCVVVDATATPLIVYTTTTTQITLTTVTSGHVLYWVCFGAQGG